MKDFWSIFFQIAVIGLIIAWLLEKLIPYVCIHLVARRLKIRDKGMIETFLVDGVLKGRICSFCRTRWRIGIDKSGQAVQYCWRCEYIFQNSTDPDPDGGLDIPSPNGVLSEMNEAKVLPFRGKNAA